MSTFIKKLFICISIFAFFSVILQGEDVENPFLFTLAEQHFANTLPEIKERAMWFACSLQKENFHLLKEHPFPGFTVINTSSLCQTGIVFFYGRNKAGIRLRGAEINKKIPQRSIYSRVGVSSKFEPLSYEEFMQAYDLYTILDEEGRFTSITFHNLEGKRKITFDSDERILTNKFEEYSKERQEKRTEFRKLFEQEIQDSCKQTAETKYEASTDATTKIPAALKHKDVMETLQRIKSYRLAVVAGKTLPFLDNAVFPQPITYDKTIYVYIFYDGNNVTLIGVKESAFDENIGSFMVFDEQSRLQKYAEGVIHFDLNATGRNAVKTAVIPPKGSGTEITFHTTGYPARYRTIVKGNLFGRQIEWNDKGEVISDVDLDIPKPWADAPKKPAAPVAMRMWTSSGGKYHIRAEYVSADENQVILKNEAGKVFPVALSKLSTDDRNYVKEQLAAKPELPKSEKE
ncbi:MAG: hypothetical protein LBT46_14880 [Planctomycetaceae bacterium]|jgi:hypothetical protein|nr:hypothetical protein [Planctomycetaceae bacterium]